jgi:predicted metal-dependent hydrolase
MKQLLYGTLIIKYEIDRVKRKKLSITVSSDGCVSVKAPIDATDELIEKKIRKRVPWILKQQNCFKSSEKVTPASRYVSGEVYLYLGKEYILHVNEGKRNNVSLRNHFLYVEISKMSVSISLEQKQQHIERLINEWYKEHARIKFTEIADPIVQRFMKYDINQEVIYIQKMENCWGRCTLDKKIVLNPELIKTHKQCIEYVITHELCHLLHKNHTSPFYRLLTAEMPDWKQGKDKLDQMQSYEGWEY